MKNVILYSKNFLKDKNKKGVLRIITELIHFGWLKKEMPIDYIRKFLYRKEVNNYKDYLTEKQTKQILKSKKIVFPEISSILDNKLSTHFYFENLNLPVPKLIGYNLNNSFFFNKKIENLSSNEDLYIFFITVFKQSSLTHLFLKPLKGNAGKGIILLKKNTLQEQIQTNRACLISNSYIHQEVLIQHPEINKIHSKSINTLRIETYIDSNNKVHILSLIMRFGVDDNIVDNVSNGGFLVPVNLNNGELEGNGYQSLISGGRVYSKHPTSNVLLDGIKIPFFKEACEIAKQAALHLPNKVIGWDIAITQNGPIIIEGNKNPGMIMTDIAFGGYLKHPLIKELLNITS